MGLYCTIPGKDLSLVPILIAEEDSPPEFMTVHDLERQLRYGFD